MKNATVSGPPRVVLVQTAIADYRDEFIRLLCSSVGGLQIQVGDVYFETTTMTSARVKSERCVVTVENVFFCSRRLCWQRLRWKALLGAEIVIGELNPRLLSTWVMLLLRRITRKRTILWGHAWARSGLKARTEPIRHLMRWLADGLILYTNRQRLELITKYPAFKESTFVAPNSLYRRALMVGSRDRVRGDFVYVGRLVEAKKVHVLIEAFARFSKVRPTARLHIVGGGDRMAELEELAKRLSLPSVVFHGHVADPLLLAGIYASSVASISPGYVGLSITQSFSFGVPMIVSRDEPHSPELEALIPDLNGSFFETDDPSSLCDEMERWYLKRTASELNDVIIAKCKESYSVERMVDGFLEAIV